MARVEIYTKAFCSYCARAKRLLDEKGAAYEEFEITFASPPQPGLGKPRDYILSLRPRQAQSQVKEITFVVDPDSFLVRESVLLDGQGNTNDMLFSDIKIGSGVPDSTFRWSPPAGTRVIDTAKLGK